MKIEIPNARLIEECKKDGASEEEIIKKATGAAEETIQNFPSIVSESFNGYVAEPPDGLRQILEVLGDPDPRPNILKKGYRASSSWESKYCTTVSSSQIAGYHKRIYMHKVVAPVFKEAMRRCQIALDELGIRYKFNKIGCFNVRHKQYDEKKGWSMHSWAAAFDINPENNKWAPADLKPFTGAWRKYSDIPEVVTVVFKNLGFQWGGDWSSGRDTMHFQYAKGY